MPKHARIGMTLWMKTLRLGQTKRIESMAVWIEIVKQEVAVGFLVLPTHFCRQNFCCSFCKHAFFEASVFSIVETWDFRESEKTQYGKTSLVTMLISRIIHEVSTFMSRSLGNTKQNFWTINLKCLKMSEDFCAFSVSTTFVPGSRVSQ